MAVEHTSKVAKKIELLCARGCSQVIELLKKAENGNNIEELAEFSATEVNQIINELRHIMAIYDTDDDK